MSVRKPSLFRQDAVNHYIRNQEKNHLPRFVPLPTLVFVWIMVLGLLILGFFAWYQEVPVYKVGTGVILQGTDARQKDAHAVLFFPISQAKKIKINQMVQITIESVGVQVQSRIEKIEGVSNPFTIRQKYTVSERMVAQPALVVLVTLQNISSSLYAGSSLQAQVEIGKQRLIQYIPLWGSVEREEVTHAEHLL